jgi:hypothetical protein
MSTKYFNSMADYGRELERMRQSMSPANRQTWLRRVMGETIRDLIKVSFLAGKDGDKNRWTSSAARTKLGDRFAFGYYTRPSGAKVTSDKVRLTDTGALRDSYQILSATPDKVSVGPKGQRRNAIGQFATTNKKIATVAETVWGNAIAGFGSFREQVIMLELNKVWEHFANGIPISRIRKPNVRAI